MQVFGVLMLLHVVVIGGLVAARALHAKLLALFGPALQPEGGGAGAPGVPPGSTFGRPFEEYVQAGLVDLRIMLVQAARHRRD